MVLDRQNPKPSMPATSSAGVGSTSVEGSDLVSNNSVEFSLTGSPKIQRPTGPLTEMVPQLAMCPVSGKDSLVAAFQRRLRSSCYNLGKLNQVSLMTHTSRSGLAGVLKEVTILFQDQAIKLLGLCVIIITCDGASDNGRMFIMFNDKTALSYNTNNIYSKDNSQIFYF